MGTWRHGDMGTWGYGDIWGLIESDCGAQTVP